MATKLKQFTVVNGELFHRKTGFKVRYKMENIKLSERFVYQLNPKTGKYKKIGTLGKFTTKRAEKHVKKYYREKQRKYERSLTDEERANYYKAQDERFKREDEEYQDWYNKREEERIEREREREREEQNEEIDELEIEDENQFDTNRLTDTQLERGTKPYYDKLGVTLDKYQLMRQNFHLIADELLKRGLIDLNQYQDILNKFDVTMEYPWSVQRDKVLNMLWDKLKSNYPEEGFKYMDLESWFV